MAPLLAGRPPFATDQPDSLFADLPKPTPRPKKQNVDTTVPGGARDSAYTAFDSYFTSGNPHDPRASGIDDIGRGLMNADYDDDSDDEQPQASRQPPPANGRPADKHRALYAAATAAASSEPPPPSYERGAFRAAQEKRTPAPLKPSSTVRTVKQPQAVFHDPPNELHLSQYIEPSTPPANVSSMPRPPLSPPASLQVADGRRVVPPHLRHPQPALVHGQELSIPSHGLGYNGGMPRSPLSPSSRTPQPLPPPQSPILPVFARPRKEPNAIKFDEKAEILRGNSEETLLARGTGGKGDDFWRRFSMVARVEANGGSKKSAWLKKTENGTTSLAKWVWIVGILLLAAIGAGIGVGWYFTHNKPASQPVAIGGSANEVFTTSTSSASSTSASTKPTKVTAAPAPTNTSNNNKREALLAVSSAHRRSHVSRVGH